MRLSPAPGPSPRRTRPAAVGITVLAAVAGLLVATFFACASDAPRPSVSLLPLAEPVFADRAGVAAGVASGAATRSRRFAGVPEPWPLDRPGRLRLASSERLAVVTTPEVAWEMPVSLGAGDRLVLSASRLRRQDGTEGAMEGGSPRPAVGRLLLVSGDGEERTLGALEAAAGEWADFELRVAEAGKGRLRLVSPSGPTAWAGLLLLRDQPAPPARPNLLLVSVDTLRADRLAAYGAERPVAPNLDRFAESSLVFEHSLSTSTWTLPSHASMFTGLLPDQHGLLSHHDRLPADLPTVARRLAEVGYHTVGITDGGLLHPRWGLAAGFDRWDWTEGQPWEPKDVRVVVERARAWMEANRFEPYFLFVHTYETHQPYTNPEGFADPFLPGGTEGPARLNVFELQTHPPDPEERRWATALYDGGVARMDHHLGGWLLELAEAGRLDGTAVVVTSDHGEELGEHGGYEHGVGKVFDENIRVPLLVRPPRGGEPGGDGAGRGGSVTTPVTSLDLAPTLLAWAGASDPSLPGRPLMDLAADPDRERPVLAHGVNSLEGLDERRYRLDLGDRSLVLDRVRAVLRSFDRSLDPGMERPRVEATADGDGTSPGRPRDQAAGRATDVGPAPGLARLQAILAWAEGGEGADGRKSRGDRLAVALPPGAATVEAGRGSAVVPRGVWDGVTWRRLDAGVGPVPLRPGLPALLTFDLRRGNRPRELRLGTEALVLREARWTEAPGWSPIDGRLPAPGEIFRTAGRGAPATLELDDEARQELRALGYLQ